MNITKIQNPITSISYGSLPKKKKDEINNTSYLTDPINKGAGFFAGNFTGSNFNGKISNIDKKGNNWTFEYINGKIAFSYKNGILYKLYSYNDKIPENMKENHVFTDGTKIEEDQYFGIDDIQTSLIYVKDKDNGDVSYTIIRNNNPKYKDEPVVKVKKHSIYSSEKKPAINTVYNKDGIEKTEIKTLEEASEYFMKNYGIEADFINLKQVHVLKDAIEDFAALNYQGKGKKLFDCLKIIKGYDFPEAIACTIPYIEYDKNKSIEDIDESEFVCQIPIVMFNTDYDWENFEKTANMDYLGKFHPYKKIKGYIIHELAHVINYQNSPKLSAINDTKTISNEEKAIVSEVSGYSKENLNEFISEYIAGRMDNNKYSKEVNALYKKCGGPDLFND